MSVKELHLDEFEALQIIKALSSQTNRKILHLLAQDHLDVSTIAAQLNLSQPNVSDAVQQLERLHLVKTSYAPGKRGIRKVCGLAIEKLTLTFKEQK